MLISTRVAGRRGVGGEGAAWSGLVADEKSRSGWVKGRIATHARNVSPEKWQTPKPPAPLPPKRGEGSHKY